MNSKVKAALAGSITFALAFAPMPASAVVCQAGAPDCVLPVMDAPPPAPPRSAPPPAEEAVFMGPQGFFAPSLLSFLALAPILAALLIMIDGDDDVDLPEEVPISP